MWTLCESEWPVRKHCKFCGSLLRRLRHQTFQNLPFRVTMDVGFTSANITSSPRPHGMPSFAATRRTVPRPQWMGTEREQSPWRNLRHALLLSTAIPAGAASAVSARARAGHLVAEQSLWRSRCGFWVCQWGFG